ncbi:ER lumen protein retaining receptor [Culex quinquefasciatus]|uniref:ER lumen protein retaining receptor n=1 Tax=Culex quinquefasciatus TaxID=7176 RepID=B0X854_CULQU|nr:ER lumen protein retaining receptor [Culex quinquefasciatus]|eukprot:XP_001865826.1 ER lumen protein retaining receptor [Culex quinquefasciatus]
MLKTVIFSEVFMFAIRVFGDFLHVLSFAVLLAKLWRTKSCAGISGKSQILYAIVFTMRYLDLPVNISADAFYLSSMKVVYIAISFMIVYMIYGPYKKSYDRDQDVLYNEFLVVPCFVLALYSSYNASPIEVLWTFSIFLEAIAIIPQLDLLCKIEHVDGYVVCYLLALGLYRAMYLLKWAWLYYTTSYYEPIALFAGFVQTTLFALVFVRVFTMKQREQKSIYRVVV